MSFHLSKPSYPLSLFVKQYWAIDDCAPENQPHIQRLVPTGLIDLMFYIGTRPTSLDNNRSISENSIVSGQLKDYYDISISEQLSMFSIVFQPYGAKLFFNIPSNEFFDQNVPLKYLVKDAVSELETKLYMSVTFEERVAVVEDFLMMQLKRNYNEFEMKRIVHSISMINNARGVISIDTLSSESCLSRKQFERSFSNYIGSSPKQFLRTVRFQNTLFVKQMNKEMPLTQLAYACGYYDQSHMINDYKQISGITPTQYFAECEPFSDYFI